MQFRTPKTSTTRLLGRCFCCVLCCCCWSFRLLALVVVAIGPRGLLGAIIRRLARTPTLDDIAACRCRLLRRLRSRRFLHRRLPLCLRLAFGLPLCLRRPLPFAAATGSALAISLQGTNKTKNFTLTVRRKFGFHRKDAETSWARSARGKFIIPAFWLLWKIIWGATRCRRPSAAKTSQKNNSLFCSTPEPWHPPTVQAHEFQIHQADDSALPAQSARRRNGLRPRSPSGLRSRTQERGRSEIPVGLGRDPILALALGSVSMPIRARTLRPCATRAGGKWGRLLACSGIDTAYFLLEFPRPFLFTGISGAIPRDESIDFPLVLLQLPLGSRECGLFFDSPKAWAQRRLGLAPRSQEGYRLRAVEPPGCCMQSLSHSLCHSLSVCLDPLLRHLRFQSGLKDPTLRLSAFNVARTPRNHARLFFLVIADAVVVVVLVLGGALRVPEVHERVLSRLWPARAGDRINKLMSRTTSPIGGNTFEHVRKNARFQKQIRIQGFKNKHDPRTTQDVLELFLQC